MAWFASTRQSLKESIGLDTSFKILACKYFSPFSLVFNFCDLKTKTYFDDLNIFGSLFRDFKRLNLHYRLL